MGHLFDQSACSLGGLVVCLIVVAILLACLWALSSEVLSLKDQNDQSVAMC